MSSSSPELADMRNSCTNIAEANRSAIDKLKTCLDRLEKKEAEVVQRETQLMEKEKDLVQREDAIIRREEDLEKEKTSMVKAGIGQGDLIGLNFGGEHVVTVKRSLLIQFEDSMLASMFSGRYEDQLDRDKDGNVFLDYSPIIMVPLIEYLRKRRDSAPEMTLTVPEISDGYAESWESMLNFFGLSSSIGSEATTKFSGIQLDVKITDLCGWTLFYCKTYDHNTSVQDLIPPKNLRGNCLLLGSRGRGSDKLTLAAMGRMDVIAAQTEGEHTQFHNGVYWYCNGKNIGFAPTSNLSLAGKVLDDFELLVCNKRLSWSTSYPGGRAGSVFISPTSTFPFTDWEKVIFVGSMTLED